jgi:2-haloacid dehalogenase
MRWITFDCFGTLVDWNSGFSSILQPLAGDRTPALLAAYHRYERLVEAETGYRPYEEVLAESLSRAATETGIAIPPAHARALGESWGRLPAFPDVEAMLSALRKSGYRVAVLTNCDNHLFAVTHQAFVTPFDMVVTAEQVRDYKPSLAHFRRFAALAQPRDWIHVACSWYYDIAPAQALGVKRIWLDRDRTGEPASAASARVSSAGEVPAAAASLL